MALGHWPMTELTRRLGTGREGTQPWPGPLSGVGRWVSCFNSVPLSDHLESDSLQRPPPWVQKSREVKAQGARPAPVAHWVGAHQLLQLPLPVAQLLVHALPHVRALQRGDDLQLGVVVVNDVVLQHQAQDLRKPQRRVTGEACGLQPLEGDCR